MVLLKEEFTRKLVFLCGLKPQVWKIVYQKMDILDTCQGLMNMMECMECKGPPCPKGEIKNKVTYKQHVDPSSGNKGWNMCKWGTLQVKSKGIKIAPKKIEPL